MMHDILGVVLFLVIIVIPWTILVVHEFQKHDRRRRRYVARSEPRTVIYVLPPNPEPPAATGVPLNR